MQINRFGVGRVNREAECILLYQAAFLEVTHEVRGLDSIKF